MTENNPQDGSTTMNGESDGEAIGQKRASELSGIPTADGRKPIIPPSEWDERNVVDDVTGNPETDAPVYVVDAVIDFHGSREAAGLDESTTSASNSSSVDSLPGESSAEQDTASVGESTFAPEGAHSASSSKDNASTAGSENEPVADGVSVEPEDPLADPAADEKTDDAWGKFDAKAPETVTFWEELWEAAELTTADPMSREYLKGALQGKKGLRSDQTDAAITVGTEAGVLLADDHDNDTYYAVATPQRAPGRYLETPAKYDNPGAWEGIWEHTDTAPSQGVEDTMLPPAVFYSVDDCSREESIAIVAAAEYQGVLEKAPDGYYYLSDERFPSRWRAVWDYHGKTPGEDGLKLQEVVYGLGFEEGLPEEAANEAVAAALENRVIWEARDGLIHLNDPTSERGPEIGGGFVDSGGTADGPQGGSAGSSDHESSTPGESERESAEQPAGESPGGTSETVGMSEVLDGEGDSPAETGADGESSSAGTDKPSSPEQEDGAESDAAPPEDAESESEPESPTSPPAEERDGSAPAESAASGADDSPTAQANTEDSPNDAQDGETNSPTSAETSSTSSNTSDNQPQPNDDEGDSPDDRRDDTEATASAQADSGSSQQDRSGNQAESSTSESGERLHRDGEQRNKTVSTKNPETSDAVPDETTSTADQPQEPNAGPTSDVDPSEPSTASATADVDDTPAESATTSSDETDTEPTDNELDSLDDAVTDEEGGVDEIGNITLPDDVQAAFTHAIEFFHGHLDWPLHVGKAEDASSGIEPDFDGQHRSDSKGWPWPSPRFDTRVRWPETAREYFQAPDHEVPDVDGSIDEIMPDAASDDQEIRMLPEGFETRYSRRWSPETVDEKRLGYAPFPSHRDVVRFLHAQGHDRETILKTGFCYDTSRDGAGTSYPEPPKEPLGGDWQDWDYGHEELDLGLMFKGRFVLPYFNQDGDPVYTIGRQVGEGYDANRQDAKYKKLSHKGKPIDEPIYGLPSIREGEGLVITEGIADAITAHQFGIPCISPVTTKFKQKHSDILSEIIEQFDIPAVYLIQDADPVSASARENSRASRLPEDVQQRIGLEHWVRDATDDAAIAAKAADGDQLDPQLNRTNLTPEDLPDPDDLPDVTPWDVPLRNVEEPPPLDVDPGAETQAVDKEAVKSIHHDEDESSNRWSAVDKVGAESRTSMANNRTHGPINAGLSIEQHGPGVKGAVETASKLYFDLHDAQEEPPTDTYPSFETQTAILTRADFEAAQQAHNQTDEQSDAPVLTHAQAPMPVPLNKADRQTQSGGPQVHIIELPQFGGEKTDLDDYLLDNWLEYCPPADWVSRTIEGLKDDGEAWSWLMELAQDNAIRLDPRPYENLLEAPDSYDYTPTRPSFLLSFSPPYLHPSYFDYDIDQSIKHRAQARTLATVEQEHTNAAADEGSDSDTSVRELFQLTFADVGVPLTRGGSDLFRGKNPIEHEGDSEDYFVVIDRGCAYDHKKGAAYNPITYLLVEAGVRDVEEPGGKLSDAEMFALWEYAKGDGYISNDVAVPRRAMNWLAVEQGFIDESELEEATWTSEDGTETTYQRLPTEAYNKTLDFIETEIGLDPGRPRSKGSPSLNDGVPKSAFEVPGLADSEEPIVVFFEKYINTSEEPNDDKRVMKKTLRFIYREWAAINDVDTVNDSWFGRKLNDNLPFEKESGRVSWKDYKRPEYYKGITLSMDGEQLRQYVEENRNIRLPVGDESSVPEAPVFNELGSIREYEDKFLSST